MLVRRQRPPWAAAISWQSVAGTADRSKWANESRAGDRYIRNRTQHHLFARLSPVTVEGAPLYLLGRRMCQHSGRNHQDASPVAAAIACCSSQMHRNLDQWRRGYFEDCCPGGLCHSCMSGVTRSSTASFENQGFPRPTDLSRNYSCRSTFFATNGIHCVHPTVMLVQHSRNMPP